MAKFIAYYHAPGVMEVVGLPFYIGDSLLHREVDYPTREEVAKLIAPPGFTFTYCEEAAD